MTLRFMLLTVSLAAMMQAPAYAEYVDAHYTGMVEEAAPGSPTPVGTPIVFNVVYDTSKLVDVTQSLNNYLGGDYFTNVETVSLSDDPNDSLSIQVGSVDFNKFDQENYGTPGGDCGPGPNCNLGVGDFPVVEYIDRAFAGVGNIFIDGQKYTIDADPIAYTLSGGFGLNGPGTGPYQFYLGRDSASTYSPNPFVTGEAVGEIDLSTLTITDEAPEPAAWLLMMLGVFTAGAALRRSGRTGRSRSGPLQA